MSAYKTPIVCKEVIIPFERSVDDGITLDQYRKKYGIDLRDFFSFDQDNNLIMFKQDRSNILRLNVYIIGTAYPVMPLQIISDTTNSFTLIAICDFEYDQESDIPNAVVLTALAGIYWDHTNKVLKYYEL